MKKKSINIDISPSSGNIFADLDLPNSDLRLLKMELAYHINRLIKEKNLTQKQTAHILAIDQPKISALSRGRLSGFSIERLFRFFLLLDQDIEIIIKPNKKNKKKNHIFHIPVKYISKG